MKRIIALVLVLVLFIPVAFAENSCPHDRAREITVKYEKGVDGQYNHLEHLIRITYQIFCPDCNTYIPDTLRHEEFWGLHEFDNNGECIFCHYTNPKYTSNLKVSVSMNKTVATKGETLTATASISGGSGQYNCTWVVLRDNSLLYHTGYYGFSESIPATQTGNWQFIAVVQDAQEKVEIKTIYTRGPIVIVTDGCTHENTTTESTGNLTYEQLNDQQHTAIENVKDVCSDCGATVSTEYQVSKHEPHVFDAEGKCVCGYIKETEDTPELQVSVSMNTTAAFKGDKLTATASVSGGSGKYACDWVITCNGAVVEMTAFDPGLTYVYYANQTGNWKFTAYVTDKENSDLKTVSASGPVVTVTECTHENTTTESIGNPSYEQLNDQQHTVIETVKDVCSNCGAVVKDEYTVTQPENHAFNKENKCTLCGYVVPDETCKHTKTKEVTQTTYNENGICDNDPDRHYRTVYKKRVCSDCKEVIENSETTNSKYENHNFDATGKCVCGYIEQMDIPLPSFTSKDSDGDGLYDHWELYGVDYEKDGVIDVPIHLMGADPYVPDVFVEIDWMEKDSLFSNKSFAPDPAALKMVYQSYKDHGINLHLDAGPDSIDYVTGKKWGDLSGSNAVEYKRKFYYKDNSDWGDWRPMLNANISFNRVGVFRHCIFVDKLYEDDDSVWGLTLSPTSFFGVSQYEASTTLNQATTFMHELGHTLGLPDDSPLYKPNNLSVMNYVSGHYGGLRRTDGTRIVNYSEFELPALDENNLNELRGIDPYLDTLDSKMTAVFRVRNWAGLTIARSIENNGAVAGAAIDFNRDGEFSKSIRFDLNGDGEYSIFAPSFNEWDALDYSSGLKTTRVDSEALKFEFLENVIVMAEPPVAQLRRDGVYGQPGDVALEQVMPSVLYSNTQGQMLTVKLKNLNPAAAQVTLTLTGDVVEGGTNQADVALAASDDGFAYATMSLPVPGDLKAGSYPLAVKVDCHNGTIVTENLELVVEDVPIINLAVGDTYVIDDKNDPDTLVWKSSDNNIASVRDGMVSMKQSGTALITVANPDGDIRTWSLNALSSLKIVRQPADQHTYAGGQAQFTISATGDALEYQWYINRNDGNGWRKLKNAVETTYITSVTELDNDGYQYHCVVKDANGNTVTSDVAVLHISPDLPKTGDEFKPLLWLSVCMLSVFAIVFLFKKANKVMKP